MPFLKSPAVARLLGVNLPCLLSLPRTGRMAPPQKDSSGHYVWTDADIDRARQALAIDRRRKQPRSISDTHAAGRTADVQ
jgi:DNA-binding transcriptional MerR regulator